MTIPIISQMDTGTLPAWGAFLSLLAILMGAVTVYIRGIPDRFRVKNEARQIEINEAELIRADYAKQIADFRTEVHGYRNDLQAVMGKQAETEKELERARSVSRQRSDRINNMMFIIRLLISELRRLDPTSIIVKQAEAMLLQMGEDDPHKSMTLNAAEHAVEAAENTVAEVKSAESKK